MKAGRVVIITGAAGGIGALVATRFLANGDTVVATDATDGALAKLASSVAKGSKLHKLSADISDQASCTKLADFARDKAGQVNVLVNCAGYFPTQALAVKLALRHAQQQRLRNVRLRR
jgi:NAD(P)-dependent dehydrogenase (short-subunit alcohol dehydrogenase family)